MEQSALYIKDASIGYRDGKSVNVVASGISVSAEKGELVALIGRNGAGKSTLLRTLAAYQKPLSGIFRYDGTDLESLSMKDIARRISVVLTGNAAMADMSVLELVSLGRTPYTGFWGSLSGADKEIVGRAMDVMGVTPFAGRSLSMLSDGERQKCLVAKAIAQQTSMILLDEPTAYLDYQSKVHLMQMLKRLAADEGKAVVVSTHDLELALRIADKLWIISDGRLVAGTLDELTDSGALQAFVDDGCIVYNTKDNRIEFK